MNLNKYLLSIILIFFVVVSNTCVNNQEKQIEMDEQLAGYEARITIPDKDDRVEIANYQANDHEYPQYKDSQ